MRAPHSPKVSNQDHAVMSYCTEYGIVRSLCSHVIVLFCRQSSKFDFVILKVYWSSCHRALSSGTCDVQLTVLRSCLVNGWRCWEPFLHFWFLHMCLLLFVVDSCFLLLLWSLLLLLLLVVVVLGVGGVSCAGLKDSASRRPIPFFPHPCISTTLKCRI